MTTEQPLQSSDQVCWLTGISQMQKVGDDGFQVKRRPFFQHRRTIRERLQLLRSGQRCGLGIATVGVANAGYD